MQVLIGCAKDMSQQTAVDVPFVTTPRFVEQARKNAVQMMDFSPEELVQLLHVSPVIANETWMRYQHFLDTDGLLPAIQAYIGVVFKHLGLEAMDSDDYNYMHNHVWITSFLYGLLRPLDGIKPYRLEGKVVLPDNGVTMFAMWKPLLTDVLIDSVKADDGVLVDLASSEMRGFFDWKRVKREVKVIKPDFLVNKDGIVKNVTVYAKMCRGAMTGYIVKNRLCDLDSIKDFTFNGFAYHGDGKNELNPVFVKI